MQTGLGSGLPLNSFTMASSTAWDDDFDGTTLGSKWVSTITGGLTIANSNLRLDGSTAGAGVLKTLLQPRTATGFRVRIRIGAIANGSATNQAGICLKGAGGNLTAWMFGPKGVNPLCLMQNHYSSSAYISTPNQAASPGGFGDGTSEFFLQLRVTSTTVFFDYSKSGLMYDSLYSETLASWIGTLSNIGIYTEDTLGVRIDYFKLFEDTLLNP